jgi:hypothetical protein
MMLSVTFLLAASAIPFVRASTVCYTNAFGYSSCGSSWGYGWGISIAVCKSKSALFFYRLLASSALALSRHRSLLLSESP